jgi:hypothetical protein
MDKFALVSKYDESYLILELVHTPIQRPYHKYTCRIGTEGVILVKQVIRKKYTKAAVKSLETTGYETPKWVAIRPYRPCKIRHGARYPYSITVI